MTISHDEAYAIATGNRLLAADMFGRLTEDQWRAQSLCAGWTVREVAAHLVPPEKGFRKRDFARQLIRYRGSLDRLVEGVTRETAKLPVETLVRHLRDRAGMRLDAPVIGPFAPMADTAIHLRDAARPLGLDVNPEPASWRPVLDFLVTKHAQYGFRAADRLDGLRLEATDQDWPRGWRSHPRCERGPCAGRDRPRHRRPRVERPGCRNPGPTHRAVLTAARPRAA